jgi:hypothetical protein
MLGKVREWADKARRWTTYWLMRAALKLHEETFIIMCDSEGEYSWEL